LESVQPPPRRAVPGADVITRRRCNDRSVTYRQKATVSYSDMLAALRRELIGP
jgi:hypothetical protein